MGIPFCLFGLGGWARPPDQTPYLFPTRRDSGGPRSAHFVSGVSSGPNRNFDLRSVGESEDYNRSPSNASASRLFDPRDAAERSKLFHYLLPLTTETAWCSGWPNPVARAATQSAAAPPRTIAGLGDSRQAASNSKHASQDSLQCGSRSIGAASRIAETARSFGDVIRQERFVRNGIP